MLIKIDQIDNKKLIILLKKKPNKLSNYTLLDPHPINGSKEMQSPKSN